MYVFKKNLIIQNNAGKVLSFISLVLCLKDSMQKQTEAYMFNALVICRQTPCLYR